MSPEFKELLMILLAALGTVVWGIISWAVVRIVNRADSHSKRIDALEKGHAISETAIPNIEKIVTLKQDNLQKGIERVEEMLEEQNLDNKMLDTKINDYILKSANERGEIYAKVIDVLSKFTPSKI